MATVGVKLKLRNIRPKYKTIMKCKGKSNFNIKTIIVCLVNYCNFNYCKYKNGYNAVCIK